MDIVSPFIDGQNEIHEEFGKLLIKDIEQCILDTLSLNQKQDINYFFVVICFSFASKILSSNFVENTIFSDMHLIIAGVVDADRLDYCSRDAFCSALNMDRFNYKRFINGYTLIQRTYISDNYEHFFFAPPAKNLNMIHDLLRRRYRIFSDINYHHRVHKHEIILEKIICDLGLMELEDMSTITPLPKNVLPLEVSSIWKLVKETKKALTSIEEEKIKRDVISLVKEDNFNKLSEDSKSYLITGYYLYTSSNLNSISGADYSSIIITFSKILENELKRRYYYNYLNYLKLKNYPLNEYPNQLLYINNNKLSIRKEHTIKLGNFEYMFNGERNSANQDNIPTYSYDRTHDLVMLYTYNKEEVFTTFAMDNYKLSIDLSNISLVKLYL